MLVRLSQPEKAPIPIYVILSGIFIEVRLLQPPKAACSIEVTCSGIVMLAI